MMSSRLIIDGNSVYEIDEDCEKRKSEGPMHRQSIQESDEKKDAGKKKSGAGPKEQAGGPKMPDS